MEEKLNKIRDGLLDLMCWQMEDVSKACSKEMYEIMDIIKDVEEAKYYHQITEAMKTEPATTRANVVRPNTI